MTKPAISEDNKLEELRTEIDDIDMAILHLLAERKIYETTEFILQELLAIDDEEKERQFLVSVRTRLRPETAEKVMELVCLHLKKTFGEKNGNNKEKIGSKQSHAERQP